MKIFSSIYDSSSVLDSQSSSTILKPATTSPKTTCMPSSQVAGLQVM